MFITTYRSGADSQKAADLNLHLFQSWIDLDLGTYCKGYV